MRYRSRTLIFVGRLGFANPPGFGNALFGVSMSQAQLYLWSGARGHIIELHGFYVEQIKSRILRQFDDLEAEADKHGQATHERIGARFGYGNVDEADVAEAAYDELIAHFLALTDLRKQVLLGGLAGMFHQWDKTLREHLERELAHYFDRAKIEKEVWRVPTAELMDVFEQFGWAVKSLPLYAKIDALQLVVNVYKHGKGRSLTELHSKYPEHVVDPIAAHMPKGFEVGLDHEWLTVTDKHFDQFAYAIAEFWSAMPERVFLELPV